ncbi:putative transcription factor AP2-EREBP family [Dioscorea sansibarensis]
MEIRTSFSSDTDCSYATISTAPPKRRAGRTKFRETRHPIYKGVRRRGSGEGRWVCEVREPNKKSRIWLGTYATAEMAARAHDVAAIALRGRSACLNFADSARLLPVPISRSPRSIRAAAAMAAERFARGEESKVGTVVDGVADAGEAPRDVGDKAAEAIGACDWFDCSEMGIQEGYYYASMAEGLLLDPPPMNGCDDMEYDADMELWSYSI